MVNTVAGSRSVATKAAARISALSQARAHWKQSVEIGTEVLVRIQ